MNQRGFTIVEMAVVVFVIGLLIVGVMAGKNLIEGGQIRAVLSEMDDYRQSMLQFKEKYYDWPGDMVNASTLWTGAANGDGDEHISWASGEGTLMWHHMELAQMIGVSGTSNAKVTDAIVGNNVPNSKIVGGGWFVDYSTALKNHLGLGTQQANGVNNGPALTGKQAYEIDTKSDDGFPTTGQVQSTGNNCFTGNLYNAGNSNTTPSCTTRFTIKSGD